MSSKILRILCLRFPKMDGSSNEVKFDETLKKSIKVTPDYNTFGILWERIVCLSVQLG